MPDWFSGRLGNLRPTRDLNYVTDTADGFVKAAETQEAIGLTINLGSNKEINIGDLATLIARLCDREIAIESEEQRERPDNSEVERLLADNTLARQYLGGSLPHPWKRTEANNCVVTPASEPVPA